MEGRLQGGWSIFDLGRTARSARDPSKQSIVRISSIFFVLIGSMILFVAILATTCYIKALAAFGSLGHIPFQADALTKIATDPTTTQVSQEAATAFLASSW